jgi:hypothetical protein
MIAGVRMRMTQRPTPQHTLSAFVLRDIGLHILILISQDHLQQGYIALVQALPWLHDKLTHLDINDAEDMLKKVSIISSKAFCAIY